jgi:hypothetical protein
MTLPGGIINKFTDMFKTNSSERSKRQLIIILALLLFFIFGFLLYREYSRQTRSNEKLAGYIIYQKEPSLRRIRQGALWLNAHKNDAVYNYDRISTPQNGLTVLEMTDGTKITLGPDTVILIIWDAAKRQIHLKNGDVTLSNNTKNYTIITNEGQISVPDNADISVRKNTRHFSVTSSKGEALLRGIKGIKRIGSGETVEITDGAGYEASALTPSSPLLNQVIYTKNGMAALDLTVHALPQAESYVFEVSTDENFSSLIFSDESRQPQTAARLPVGTYFWRSRAKINDTLTDGTPGSFTIAFLPPPIINNRDNAAFNLNGTNDSVNISWSGDSGATGYILEVAEDPDFSKPVSHIATGNQSVNLWNLNEGSYYYRVKATSGYGAMSDVEAVSAIQTFSVSYKTEEDNVELLAPHNREQFRYPNGETLPVFFNWTFRKDISSYRIEVASDPAFKNILLQKETPANFAQIDLPLNSSDYYWRIVYNSADKKAPARFSGVSSFSIKRPALIGSGLSFAAGDRDAAERPALTPETEEDLPPQEPVTPVITLTSPQGLSIDTFSTSRINFVWSSNVNQLYTLQIADTPDFKNIIYEQRRINATELSAPAGQPGRYYWRIGYSNNGAQRFTAPGEYTLVWNLPTVSVSVPQQNQVFETLDASRGLIFKWSAPRSKLFKITLARDAAFTDIIAQQELTAGALTMPKLTEGSYFFKVEGSAQNNEPFNPATVSFSVKPYRLPSATALSPADKAIINFTGQKALNFSWQQPEGATDSTLTLLKIDPQSSTGFRNIFSKTLIRGNNFNYTAINNLDEGEYLWQLQNYSRASGGNINSYNDPQEARFSITLDPLSKPQFTSPTLFSEAVQHIEWQPVSRANGYRITAVRTDAATPAAARPLVSTVTQVSFANIRLPLHGSYTITVTPLNEFKKDVPASAASIDVKVE